MSLEIHPAQADPEDSLLSPEELAPYVHMAQEKCELVTQGDAGMLRALETVVLQRNFDGITTILGEPGTGKELFARLIHELRGGPRRPFVDVNMAGISENLFQSELFGHARGSFTSADGDRTGRFEEAQDGTIFLDEIGDMPLNQQALLLRAVEQRTFSRVGDNPKRSLEAKIVCATNADIASAVRVGRMRKDLYQRLCGCMVSLPPLHKRTPEHREALIRALLMRAGHQNTRGGGEMRLDPEAFRILLETPVEGNVRGLQQVIERAVRNAVTKRSDCIGQLHVKRALADGAPTTGQAPNGWEQKIGAAVLSAAREGGMPYAVDIAKQDIAFAVWERSGRVTLDAARLLRIDRKTLSQLLREREARMGERLT